MERGASDVVGGLFATRGQAMTVQSDLRRIGLADQDIEVGVPASGRYRLDVREAEDLGSGALDGIVIGTVVGALLGVVVLVVAVPQATELGFGAIVLGILMGGFWGSFFGGLGGMVIKSAAHSAEALWCEIPERSAVLLVVARAGAHADAARKAMRRRGARSLLKQIPNMAPCGTVPAPDSPVPAGSEHPSLDRPGAIGIPRGAFLLLVIFLVAVSMLWANVYVRVVGRV